MGLKPDQGMTLRRLQAGDCLVLNKIIFCKFVESE